MTIRPIRLFGDPVLRTACEPVTRFGNALARLVDDLLDRLDSHERIQVMRKLRQQTTAPADRTASAPAHRPPADGRHTDRPEPYDSQRSSLASDHERSYGPQPAT